MIKLEMPKMVHNDEFDIDIRPYLTSQDIENIAIEMMKADSHTERNFVRDGYVLKICAPNENFEGMEYDLLKASGLIDAVLDDVVNLYEIKQYIYHAESTNMQVKELFASIVELAKKAEKKLPNNKQIQEIVKKFQEAKK